MHDSSPWIAALCALGVVAFIGTGMRWVIKRVEEDLDTFEREITGRGCSPANCCGDTGGECRAKCLNASLIAGSNAIEGYRRPAWWRRLLARVRGQR